MVDIRSSGGVIPGENGFTRQGDSQEPSRRDDEPMSTIVHLEAPTTRRIDHLLELGRLLVRLAETAIEEEGNASNFLAGSFQSTRLPLQLKEVELTLTGLQVLGADPPDAVVRLIEAPNLSRQQVSNSVLLALDEINEAIKSEALAA
jgi:hypothetical protein